MATEFNAFIQKIKSWFGITPKPQNSLHAPNTAEKKQADLLRERTAINSPTLASEMGWLVNAGVPAEKFSQYCASFANGVDYITKRYGYAPRRIVVGDRVTGGMSPNHYNAESDTIFISRDQIAKALSHPDYHDFNVHPYILTHNQGAALVGVEECYHGYQFQKHPQREQFYQANRYMPDGSYNHDNLVEKDAQRVVREAAVAMHIPATNPITLQAATLEQIAWVEKTLKDSSPARWQDFTQWRAEQERKAQKTLA